MRLASLLRLRIVVHEGVAIPEEATAMATMQEHELESEFEHELHESELESGEHEGILGSIGNVLGGLLGEGEAESEFEHEGEGELESELEGEFEGEGEFELESSEQFFGGIGKFLRRAAPVLKQVARAAAPIVGTAIGGPFGTVLGGLASNLLSEHELEAESEFEAEHESELEAEHESEHEIAHEIASHELTLHEALAEMMAEAASHEMHEGQAEGNGRSVGDDRALTPRPAGTQPPAAASRMWRRSADTHSAAAPDHPSRSARDPDDHAAHCPITQTAGGRRSADQPPDRRPDRSAPSASRAWQPTRRWHRDHPQCSCREGRQTRTSSLPLRPRMSERSTIPQL
jgi:hypothetical protein